MYRTIVAFLVIFTLYELLALSHVASGCTPALTRLRSLVDDRTG